MFLTVVNCYKILEKYYSTVSKAIQDNYFRIKSFCELTFLYTINGRNTNVTSSLHIQNIYHHICKHSYPRNKKV